MARRQAFLILTGSIALVSGCSSLQRPEIRAVRPHVTGIDLQGVSITFDVDIHNPYPIALRAPRFQYGIDIEDAEFIKSQAPVEVDLPAGQVGTATLPARLEYLQLWRTYRSLADATEVKYRLRGTVPISALGQTHELPLSHSGTFPVLRLPKIDVGKVDFSDVSLSKAKANVSATIHNPNVFAVGAKGLGYALVLGDTSVGSLSAETLESIPAGGTGELRLSGEITARAALTRILQGGGFSDARLTPTGTIQTPFGPVDLGR
jgi:LEA14-like dessication related protein